MIRSILYMLFTMSLVNAVSAQQTNRTMDFNFEQAWKKVDEHDRKGLPASALKEVNTIYDAAKKGKNTGQLIKAIIHQLKYHEATEDNEFSWSIERVRTELNESQFPAKPLLHSMLAELYWQYYQENRWTIYQRTPISGDAPADIGTWDLQTLIHQTRTQYQLSLASAGEGKTMSLEPYQPVLHTGNNKGRLIRPTLFDFVAHRALQFFKNAESELNRPAQQFSVSDEALFEDAKSFALTNIVTSDTLSLHFHALKLFRELVHLHLNDRDPSALVELDLERLQFLNTHHTSPRKEELYLKALEVLEQSVIAQPVSTRVTYQIAQQYVERARKYNPLMGAEYKWDNKRAMELCKVAIERFPDSDGAIQCENLTLAIKRKNLSATLERNNIIAEPFRAYLKYTNINEINYRVIRVTPDEIATERRRWQRNYNIDRELKFIEYFAAKAPAQTGKVALPDDGDFNTHAVEVKIDGLSPGAYMVLFSNRADFRTTENAFAYAFTIVTNIAFVHRTMRNGSTDVYTLHRKSGEPMKNVNVSRVRNRYQSGSESWTREKIQEASTNNSGFVNLPYLDDKRQRSFFLEFTSGNDWNTTEELDQNYYQEGNIYQNKKEPSKSVTQTHFFLDRGIYRPGQTIYFKGLVVETDGKNPKIRERYTTTIRLYDVNHQVQGSVEVTTNEYGTFHGTFTAPSSGLTGQMHLDNADGSGNKYFSVEEYKRPKFEVTFEPVKGTFRLDDDVNVTGVAMAYSGANIDGATVAYRVVRQARFPFWWWSRWGYPPSRQDAEITNGTATTANDGKFSITFKAIPDLSINPDGDPIFDYTVYADVTDINGETHSATTTVSVSRKALVLGVQMGTLDKDKDAKTSFPILTTNLAGEHEPARGTITIHRLKNPDRPLRNRLWSQPDRHVYSREQYRSFFPHDLYEDENNKYTWPKEKQVMNTTFDTGNDRMLSIPAIRTWDPGEYALEITARDRYDQPVREIVYFTVHASASKTLAIPAFHSFSAVRSTAEPGEKAVFSSGTSAGKITVIYELEQDGELLSKQLVTLTNEQRLFEIPVLERHRGNFMIHYTFIRENRLYVDGMNVSVPYSNKALDIRFETFRNKLQPGEKEQWKIIIQGPKAERVMAEMAATLYDASLDVFAANGWYASFFNGGWHQQLRWNSRNGFDTENFRVHHLKWNPDAKRHVKSAEFDRLNWFGYYPGTRRFSYKSSGAVLRMSAPAAGVEVADAPMVEEEIEINMDSEGGKFDEANSIFLPSAPSTRQEEFKEPEPIKARSNFNETAFFYPNLLTNERGEIIVSFTIPEALTRWRMLGFGHTKDLKSAAITNELVTQKELMVVPNQPRFFREGDTMVFSTKITSLSGDALSGQAKLEFFDALTMKPVSILKDGESKDFKIDPRASTSVNWTIHIPAGLQAVLYRVTARAGNFTDGEEMILPVVTNRMLVTESLPLSVRGGQKKAFRFEKLISNKSKTLRHQQYTLEFTANPAWYAIQALPYMMEYPYDCVEQTFSRFYANSIASHIANSNPRIKQVFDTWRNLQPDALLSNLEKNQELKSALLEETPWVLHAQDETQRKRMVGVLFDLNRMSEESARSLDKVAKAQNANGGFSWFPGFPEDRYMTQHIVSGLGHLDKLGIKSVRDDSKTWNMSVSAIGYLDSKISDDYERLKAAARRKEIKLEDNHIGYTQIHYLYARSAFPDVKFNKQTEEAFQYYLGQAKRYWLRENVYIEGMICLALHRFGEKAVTANMIKSFRERAIRNEELGMYFKSTSGYYWYQAPVETQALMIEVFSEVAGDNVAVDELRFWLLRQKQTTDWRTTKATAEACYALLLRGTNLLSETATPDIRIGNVHLDVKERPDAKVEAGTGYFKTAWKAGEIKPEMGIVEVSKNSEGPGWGAVYWQYFEQLDKITPAQTPLKMEKRLFLRELSDRGLVLKPLDAKTTLKKGDIVKVRLEIRVDRNLEYVHIKDMRAAAFEPVATLSQQKFQDGLYYYESPRDLATNFFIGYLPKGTYVFEYELRVSQQGDFSNGVTTIQCMYAPEFSSHSEGIRVTIP